MAFTALLAACGGAPTATPPASAPASTASSAKPAGSAPAASVFAASKPASAAPAASGSADWDKLVAAAKQEGTVVCGCPPIPPMRELITREFEGAYPGIKLEYTPATLPQFTTKVQAERAAGQYLQDLYVWGVSVEVFQLGDAGAFDPITSALVLPEVNDEKAWGGWDNAMSDKQHKYMFAFWRVGTSGMKYNAGVVEPGSIKSYADVADPKFKGKIVWWDPRIGGGGVTYAAFVYVTQGEAGLKKLMVDQEPLFVPNGSNDIVERMVRGGYTVGVGAGDITAVLKPYTDAGVKIDIRDAQLQGKSVETSGYGDVGLFNRAAHPNAAKVFLNWLLTKDTQTKMGKLAHYNSRRNDLPPTDPALTPQAGIEYVRADTQDFITVNQPQVIKLIKEWRPQ